MCGLVCTLTRNYFTTPKFEVFTVMFFVVNGIDCDMPRGTCRGFKNISISSKTMIVLTSIILWLIKMQKLQF